MSEMPAKGFLRTYSLPKMLTYLGRHRATGVLTVTFQDIVRKVFIRKGRAMFASSTYVDERLGEMLIKAGLLSVGQFEEASRRMKGTKRFGALLVELGFLDPKDLFWGVKFQVGEIIRNMFLLKDGIYEFDEGDIPAEVITLDLSMANIVYEGVHRITDLTRIKTELPEMDNIFMLSDDPAQLFQELSLADRDRELLSLVDGDRTISDLVDASSMSSFDTMKSLYALWCLGILTEQFTIHPQGITLDDILDPVRDSRDEFFARVNSIHAVLDSLSPHQLLALDGNVDYESINRQYYRLAKEFHPDRYGDAADPGMKDKMCEVFDAITTAYNTLKKRHMGRRYTEGDEDLALELLKTGREELKNGNHERAADFLGEAVKANPDNAECWQVYSMALRVIPDRTHEAEEAMLNAWGLDPRNVEFCISLARLYIMDGRFDDAKKYYELALELDTENPDAQAGLSTILS